MQFCGAQKSREKTGTHKERKTLKGGNLKNHTVPYGIKGLSEAKRIKKTTKKSPY